MGTSLGIGLTGSPEEQKKRIKTLFENYLDTIEIDQHLRVLRKWGKDSEVGSSESSFWLMVMEEFLKT